MLIKQKSMASKSSFVRGHNYVNTTEKDHDDSRYGRGWRRIWCYFTPKIFGFLMPLLAAIASVTWPVLGLVISKVQFIIIEMSYTQS